MPNISLTDFTPQNREVERARQYAQMLQEQATTPIEQQAVNGTPVPIGWASVLAKALQGYLGGRAARKADEKEAATKAAMLKEAVDYMNPNNLNVEQGGEGLKRIGNVQMDNPGIVDRLKGMMPQGAPQPMPQASPVVGPAPQAMSAAEANAAVGPLPTGLRVNSNAAFSEDVAKAPFAIPKELQDRTRSSEEKQRMLMAAALSDNEYLKPFAAAEYTKSLGKTDEEEKLKKQQAIIDTMVGITPEQKNQLKVSLGLPSVYQTAVASILEPKEPKEVKIPGMDQMTSQAYQRRQAGLPALPGDAALMKRYESGLPSKATSGSESALPGWSAF